MTVSTGDEIRVRYQITGMDCSDCADHIGHAAGAVEGVRNARVSLASQLLTLEVTDPATHLPQVEQAVQHLGYGIDRIDPQATTGQSTATSTDRLAPGYRRALWIVIVLNVGYGLIEAVGGVLSGSQALRADALDFFGDGVITLLGLVAISWGLLWRARSALLQGLFLGALGLGVLINTVWRLQGQYEPEAGLMGGFGVVALIINIVAALVLIPHRSGDANTRAVWLFSRNDAMGNVAVIVAALLVSFTGSAWPDVLVAFAISGLFLQSSWSIISDSLHDLREARA